MFRSIVCVLFLALSYSRVPWLRCLLPLQDCSCSIPDPKPDLLLPVYQFLFVVVYCDANCSSHWYPSLSHERVTERTHSSSSHPLHRIRLTEEASHPTLQHHMHVRILLSWSDVPTNSSTSPLDSVDATHLLSITLKSTIIRPANRSTPQFDVHSFSLPHA